MPKKAGGKRAAVPEHVRQAAAESLAQGPEAAEPPPRPHEDGLSDLDDLDDLVVPSDAAATTGVARLGSRDVAPAPPGEAFEREPQPEAKSAPTMQGRLGKFMGRAKPTFGKSATPTEHTGLGPPLVQSQRKLELEPEGINDPLVEVKAHSGHEDAHDDNHVVVPPDPPSTTQEWAIWTATGVLSGMINGMLLFVFCCVFGSMIFSTNEHLSP